MEWTVYDGAALAVRALVKLSNLMWAGRPVVHNTQTRHTNLMWGGQPVLQYTYIVVTTGTILFLV